MYYPVLNPHLIAEIAASPGARAEFEAAWRADKADIRGVTLKQLMEDGLLIVTSDDSNGWDNFHFTVDDDPGVEMVNALMAEDPEEFLP